MSHSPYKRGVVVAQDLVGWRVRVQFQDFDGVTSYWLGVGARKTQSDKDWWMPDIGEQVACLLDRHDEDGVVVCAIGSSVDTPPTGATKDQRIVEFSDGAKFTYDRSAKALTVSIPNAGTISIAIAGSNTLIQATKDKVQVYGDAVELGASGGPAVARIGDTVQVPNVQAGSDTVTGTIITGSTKVTSQ